MNIKPSARVRTIVIVLLAVVSSAVSPTIAQEGSSGDDQNLSAGELVPVVEEQHGSWFVICQQPAGQELECTMTQPVLNNQGTPAATVNIFPVTDSNLFTAAAVILTPLGTNLENGISLAVDSNSPRRYGFKFCLVDGCLARIGLLKSEVGSMKAGSVWRMVLYEGENVNNPLIFDMSLTGFTNAFDRLVQVVEEGVN